MNVHLVDGTYELFRCYFGSPPSRNAAGREVGATRGLLRSLAAWLKTGQITHIGCAFDHVIESFRNDIFPGYKTGEGIDPNLFSQFELAERAVAALGIVVWPMVEFEADDALASAAAKFVADPSVEQIRLCTPDKDLAQCVRGKQVVCYDRHRDILLDDVGVMNKFGVGPSSIPDLLGLVGDSADGIPGISRWGMKSASTVLAAYGQIELIPAQASEWKVKVRGADSLSASLQAEFSNALLYRQLAVLRTDAPIPQSLEQIQWKGANRSELTAICAEIDDLELLTRVHRFQTLP